MDKYRYIRGYIEEIVDHAPDIKSFLIRSEDFSKVYPGQFIMLWLPGYEEIPLSPSHYDGNMMRLTVKRRGVTTSRLHEMDVGDHVYVRGPYGTGFKLSMEGRYLLVAGGYGASPIIYAGHILAGKGFEYTYVEGVKSSLYSLFVDEARELGVESILVTEDGSSGVKGLVTDYVEDVVDDFDIVLGCGPEPMMIRLLRICREHDVECQLSLERHIKCGIGICGSCVLEGSGLLVCRDGPVLNLSTLVETGYGGVSVDA